MDRFDSGKLLAAVGHPAFPRAVSRAIPAERIFLAFFKRTVD
jgi:hypothetical protein